MAETKKAEDVVRRFEVAKKRKTNWTELYEDALCYYAPHRETFHDDYETPGTDKSGRGLVFDSTGQDALQRAASNIQSSLTPPFRQWLFLEPGPALEGDSNAKEALSSITKVLFTNLQNSNFDTQIAETYLDLMIGTGAMLVFKGTPDKPFNFVNVPMSQLYLEEGIAGQTGNAFRRSMMPAASITKTWLDAKLDKELKDMIKENNDKQIALIEATIQRDDGGVDYMVIVEKSKSVIVERVEKSNPWIIPRWSTIPGEIYGRGPGIFALPDVKTLNKTKELLLKSASISIFGMYTVEDDGEINVENIKLGSGAMIPVSSNGGVKAPSIQPLQVPGDPNLAQLIIADLKNAINAMMFAEPLGPIDLPVKTATEVSLRQQDLAKRIGAAFGKLQYELITPLVNRMLDILDELGLVDLGPFRVDGNNIAIQHVSPLALAQKEEELVNTLRLAETLAGLYGPEALAGLMPPDRLMKLMRSKLNVDTSATATDEEIEAGRQAVAQQLQQQMQAEQTPEG